LLKKEYEALKKEAEKAGYKTILEYLKAEGGNWDFDPKKFIEEMQNNFVDACAMGAEKIFEKGKWNPVTDTFEDFLRQGLKLLELRREEVKEKRKEKGKSFKGLYENRVPDLLDELNPALELEIDDEELDMYEEIIELSRKAIIAYMNGAF
jgi:hypothetical protein